MQGISLSLFNQLHDLTIRPVECIVQLNEISLLILENDLQKLMGVITVEPIASQ